MELEMSGLRSTGGLRGSRAAPSQFGGGRASRLVAGAAMGNEDRRVCWPDETTGGGGRHDQRTGAGARTAPSALSGIEESGAGQLDDWGRVQREALDAAGGVGTVGRVRVIALGQVRV